jgi:uncharacterized protein YbbK (DUF523 family)
MRKILVSECLYGNRAVRYDGAEIPCDDSVFLKWKSEGRLMPVCPELLGGLPVPREESQRTGDRVITASGRDVTEAFEKGAEEALCAAQGHNVICAIMKEGSPSCGVNKIHDGTFSGTKIQGQGIATERLRAAGYKVFSEKDIPAAAAHIRRTENDRA